MKITKRLRKKAGMLVLTAVLVVAALIVSVVSGGTEQVKAAENETSAETSADNGDKKSGASDKNGSESTDTKSSDKKDADSQSDKTDKTETVYAKADPSDKIYEVSVEAVLKNDGKGEISDYSTLSDIKNTEGDEDVESE